MWTAPCEDNDRSVMHAWADSRVASECLLMGFPSNAEPTCVYHHCLCDCTIHLLACTRISWKDTWATDVFGRFVCGLLWMLVPSDASAAVIASSFAHQSRSSSELLSLSAFCPERPHVFWSRCAWEERLFQCFPRACAQCQAGVALQVRAERQEPLALSVQQEHLAHSGRPLGSARPRRGWSASRLCFLVEPLGRPCAVWSHAAAFMFASAGAQRPPRHVGRRVRLRRRGVEPCG